jgi:hypothetical protein
MSNFLAIATVTTVLRQVLAEALTQDVPGSQVNIAPPLETTGDNSDPQTNLYLYQVMPNAHWRNADLASRRPNGDLVQRPVAALDLYFLLSFYGDETRLEPQRMLGSVVRTLHTRPILSLEKIQQVLNDILTADPDHFLALSNLGRAVEPIRFTPLPLSLEELTKLWSAFFKLTYALSAAYVASLVLIEGDETPQAVLPVRARNLKVVTFHQPQIDNVTAATGPGEPILASSTLLVHGQQLRGPTDQNTRLLVNQVELTPTQVGPTLLGVALSALPVEAQRAGVQSVQVIHLLDLALVSPPVPPPQVKRRYLASNVAAFVLQPKITVAVANIEADPESGSGLQKADLTVNFTPQVGRGQLVTLFLNEFQTNPALTAHSYTFEAPSWDEQAGAAVNRIVFPVRGLTPGAYLVRVQVDGAESTLDLNSQGQYSGPQVIIHD